MAALRAPSRTIPAAAAPFAARAARRPIAPSPRLPRAPAAASPSAAPARPAPPWRRPAPQPPRAAPTAGGGASVTGARDESAGPALEPTERVLKLWRSANAVCFDVDCTLTVNDSLDLLAEFMGVGGEVAAVTSRAMDGSMNLEAALEERLRIIDCTPKDIKAFIKAHPPESRLVPGAKALIAALQARGVAVYLVSGGFREMTLPIARYLGVPPDNVYANRMNWQWDDDTGEPTRLVGFDNSEPTAHNQGKPQAIARIRRGRPYNTIVMIGDGITDLEAVQVSGGADLFVGFGGVVRRPAVEAGADWYVFDYKVLLDSLKRYKVAMVGSGAWACAAAHMVAQNCAGDDPADEFADEVRMWVYEEDCEGRKLTDVINEAHENPKYLPGVSLGPNLVADPELLSTVADADVIIFCAPHQFMRGICKQLIGKIKPDAVAVSLTKGMRVRREGPQLISEMVSKYLGIDCSVLMGANIATAIGREELSEAVIGYSVRDNALLLRKLFQTRYFRVSLLADVAGAEMCGTLKNIVALAAGFIDGVGLGPNSKATVMRQGLMEMRAFAKALYPNVRDETFFEPCGVADLIATCYGGRNRLVAEEFARGMLDGRPRSFEALEADLLKGQKLQGVLTSNEVQEILVARGWETDYPLFTTVNRIVTGRNPPTDITNFMEVGKIAEATETVEVDENGVPVRRRSPPVLLTT
ncbi:glycerol-3-phosphate dehydrogenase [Raphidocelis subcapitata]|uniref:Glycerol-3-phosphate dehydrogenase [NAD(+)] n=1 Tax=Raphidocelis subcapitata TaxID=307507 RepID=A0A2V0NLH2_9CHLO|nr:glycerol-3-phosphate dehydrogenase [Raphidocelis subcapitata]|eukprot:GBF87939.1 glycerol-3-phosphate dehydrogenase [Raphidocelis subcapitata]